MASLWLWTLEGRSVWELKEWGLLASVLCVWCGELKVGVASAVEGAKNKASSESEGSLDGLGSTCFTFDCPLPIRTPQSCKQPSTEAYLPIIDTSNPSLRATPSFRTNNNPNEPKRFGYVLASSGRINFQPIRYIR
jgi:hypothetical protein